MGRILVAEGKLDEALRLLDRLVLVNPKYAPGFQMRAVALDRLGRYEDSIASMDKGLAIDPNDIGTLNRRAALLDRLGLVHEAILTLRRALQIFPADEMSLENLGKALFASKRYKDAGVVLERLVEVNPDYRYALGLLAFNRLHEANWNDLEDTVTRIKTGIRSARPTCMPLAFISISDSVDDQLQCTRLS